jgi:hypothetical protein
VVEGTNNIYVHYAQIWIYHNETSHFVQITYTNKNLTGTIKDYKTYKEARVLFGLGYEVSSKKAHALKTWSLTGFRDSGNSRRWDPDGGNGSLGVCPRDICIVPDPFPLSVFLVQCDVNNLCYRFPPP